MIVKTAEGKFIISAVEVSTFVVCPEAWRIKTFSKTKQQQSAAACEGSDLHRQWAERYGEVIDLLWRTKLVICLIVIMIVLFLYGQDHYFQYRLMNNFQVELIILSLLILIGLIVIRKISAVTVQKGQASGIDVKSTTVAIEGHNSLPVKDYVSYQQGLAGRPDAVILENGFYIPVERKPLAKKLRDRHIAQLLVYMRLIEEFEGNRPPYGYLILGPKCRRVKVYNSTSKQTWLQERLNVMNAILSGQKAIATPQLNKCARCEVCRECLHGAQIDPLPKEEKLAVSDSVAH